MDLKKLLCELCEADGMGGLGGALSVAEKYLSEFSDVRRSGNSLIASIKGNGKRKILLDAHIDEIGMMVTSIDGSFVKVAAAGGIDYRMLAAMRVKIHGKSIVNGVFCSVPPHLTKDETSAPNFDELYIDTGLKNASDIISIGDRVTFMQSFKELHNGYVTAKSLDNRSGVAALIYCAYLLKDKEIPCNVDILLSDMEELGGDGAKVEAYSIYPDEAIVVDVSFGNAPDIPNEKTGVMAGGTMIGVSPILSENITNKLINIAKNKGLEYQLEVIGGRTSTNADVVTVTRSGVPCALASIPLRNMHTPVEIVNMNDIETTAKILSEYILSSNKEDNI